MTARQGIALLVLPTLLKQAEQTRSGDDDWGWPQRSQPGRSVARMQVPGQAREPVQEGWVRPGR